MSFLYFCALINGFFLTILLFEKKFGLFVFLSSKIIYRYFFLSMLKYYISRSNNCPIYDPLVFKGLNWKWLQKLIRSKKPRSVWKKNILGNYFGMFKVFLLSIQKKYSIRKYWLNFVFCNFGSIYKQKITAKLFCWIIKVYYLKKHIDEYF